MLPLIRNTVILSVLFIGSACNAQEIKVCTRAEAIQAETEAQTHRDDSSRLQQAHSADATKTEPLQRFIIPQS